MSHLKKLAVCLAVTALLAVAASPASAHRSPEGPGQPILSGELETHGVVHCQPVMEVIVGGEIPPGTFPGSIVVTPKGVFIYANPKQGQKLCPVNAILP
jgi:hypothetical protein